MKSKEIKNEFIEYMGLLPCFIKKRILRYEKDGKSEIFLLFREYLNYLLEIGEINCLQWDNIELDKKTKQKTINNLNNI